MPEKNMVSQWYQVKKKKNVGYFCGTFRFLFDHFVSANCTAHPERPAQTNTCSATLSIYCLSSCYCILFASQHPALKGFCVCASVICFLCVWGQVFGTCSYLQQGPADRTSLRAVTLG